MRPIVKKSFCAALVAMAVLLGGCVSKPVLELYGARVAGVTPQGVTLLLTLKVNNDNAFDVRVRNVRANVTVAHQYSLPYLQFDPEQWLASDASTLVPIPMSVPWQMIAPLLATSAGSPSLAYHVHGLADVTATRLLQIQRNDYMLDEDGAFSRFDLVMAAGRGVLGDLDSPSPSRAAPQLPPALLQALAREVPLERPREPGAIAFVAPPRDLLGTY